jgi:hypothetical protein
MFFLILIFLNFLIQAKEYSLEIVSYNAQNFFDSNHDEGHEDFQFLPKNHLLKKEGCKKLQPSKKSACRKLDWNEKSVSLKISQIKKAVGNPDVLAMVEIENEIVAKKLALELGFPNFILAKKHDFRGITTSLFFKSGKVLRSSEIPVKNSRSILEVKVDFDRFGPITFFVNHWPSQGHIGHQREFAGDLLQKRIRKIQDEKIIILGDFNLDPRFESNSLFENKNFIDLSPADMGTYFFIPEKRWFGFDRILISQNLKQNVGTFSVLSKKEISGKFILKGKSELIPHPFKYNSLDPKHAGFSDHFPVRLVIIPIDRKKI